MQTQLTSIIDFSAIHEAAIAAMPSARKSYNDLSPRAKCLFQKEEFETLSDLIEIMTSH